MAILGVYSDKNIKDMISRGLIKVRKGVNEIDVNQIQPASLDLRIGGKSNGFCLSTSSLPNKQQLNLDDYFNQRSKYNLDFSKPEIYLHKNEVYVFPIKEQIELPDYLIAKTNQKVLLED